MQFAVRPALTAGSVADATPDDTSGALNEPAAQQDSPTADGAQNTSEQGADQ